MNECKCYLKNELTHNFSFFSPFSRRTRRLFTTSELTNKANTLMKPTNPFDVRHTHTLTLEISLTHQTHRGEE